MRLNPQDKSTLEDLYLHYAIPTDQLKRNRVVLGRIGASFRRATGLDDSNDEILRYMINRRKNKDWPKLGERAKRFPPALKELLEGEISVLCTLYKTINVPLDEFLLREDLPRRLVEMFSAKTGRIVTDATLVAAMMSYRKRGLLPCLESEKVAKPKSQKRAFSDIDEVARQHRKTKAG